MRQHIFQDLSTMRSMRWQGLLRSSDPYSRCKTNSSDDFTQAEGEHQQTQRQESSLKFGFTEAKSQTFADRARSSNAIASPAQATRVCLEAF